MKRFFLKGILFGCALLFAVTAVLWIWPVDTSDVIPKIHPSADYSDSAARIAALSTDDNQQDVADYCRSIFLTHGEKTEKAVVMFHGYTNCPRQYQVLAKMFFDRGYNVYVPRIPFHGLKNRVNPDIDRLTLADLIDVSDRSVDIAQGLGDTVTVLGLSLGGVLTAREAQFRHDVDIAVILVPSFGFYYLPGIVKPLLNLAYFLPDTLLWWHPIERENRPIPYSMYHKFSSHGMGHALKMSLAVLRAAKESGPLAKKIIVMTAELDRAVDYRNVECLMKDWARHGADVRHYQFPAELGVEHDIIDPLQSFQQTDVVYKKIFEMIDG